jgi:hypothetical protein
MTLASTPRSAVCSADDYFVALGGGVYLGLGRIVAVHHRSSAPYQIR